MPILSPVEGIQETNTLQNNQNPIQEGKVRSDGLETYAAATHYELLIYLDNPIVKLIIYAVYTYGKIMITNIIILF